MLIGGIIIGDIIGRPRGIEIGGLIPIIMAICWGCMAPGMPIII